MCDLTLTDYAALRLVYDMTDTLLLQGNFRAVDVLCQHWAAHIRDYAPQTVFGFLTITLQFKIFLATRPELFTAATSYLTEVLGAQRAKKALQGLE